MIKLYSTHITLPFANDQSRVLAFTYSLIHPDPYLTPKALHLTTFRWMPALFAAANASISCLVYHSAKKKFALNAIFDGAN